VVQVNPPRVAGAEEAAADGGGEVRRGCGGE